MKRRSLNLVGVVVAVFALLVAIATPVSAGDWKLKAEINGTIQITAVGENGPTAAVYSGQGKGTDLGITQMEGDITITGPAACAGGFTATHIDILTAANGDQLTLELTETSCPRPESPNVFDCSGTYVIVGGTGRFSNQTGSGNWGGTVTLSPSGSGTFSTVYSN